MDLGTTPRECDSYALPDSQGRRIIDSDSSRIHQALTTSRGVLREKLTLR